MEVIIKPRSCPGCSKGTVRFRGSVADIACTDAVIIGRCNSCKKEYEQPFYLVQSEDLIPLDED